MITFPSRNRRKVDQHRRMASMAMADNDRADHDRHLKLAREYEQAARKEEE